MILRSMGLCAASLLGLAVLAAPPQPEPGRQTPQEFRREIRTEHRLDYLLYVPKAASTDPAKRWPLVLFLHGAGERGTNLNAVAVHGPPKLVAAGKEFPFILASPQCPPGQVWNTTTLMALIDELQATLPVDSRRVHVTGLSMGGYGTWELAVKHPERFASVAPICGGGERIRTLLPAQRQALKTLGVWAFHGGKDNVVVPAESERMIEAFKKAGNEQVKYTVYPEAGHDSWTQAYNDPALFDWLLQHSR
jgi:predicted peptidase